MLARMLDGARRDQRRVLEAIAVASLLSGAPSTLWALRGGGPGGAVRGGLEATRAIGTLLGTGRPGLASGALAHLAVSLAVGELLAQGLPQRGATAWGALAGLAIGWVNLAVIAPRRYPRIAALGLWPQLADNAAFGVIFALVADR